MSSSRVVLPVVRIPSPCSADWSGMSGDHATRFCGLCRKLVHNLSAGSARDAARILALESPCVRFHSRRDGSVFTRPHKPPNGLSRAVIVGAALLASAYTPSPHEQVDAVHASSPIAQADKVVLPPAATAHGEPVAGKPLLATPREAVAAECAKTAPASKGVVTPKRLVRTKGKPMSARTGSSAAPAPSDDPLAGL